MLGKDCSNSGIELAAALVGSMLGRIRSVNVSNPLLQELAVDCVNVLGALEGAQLEHPQSSSPSCGVGRPEPSLIQALDRLNPDISALPTKDSQVFNECQLHLLINSTKMALYVVRPDDGFAVTFISEGVAEILGYEPSQFRNDPKFWMSRLDPAGVANVLSEFRRLRKLGFRRIECRMRHADGSYRWVSSETRLIRDAQGRPELILGCAVDTTERRAVEQALRDSEERFRQVTEAIDQVFWMTNVPKSEMLYISPAYERIWGRTCKSLYDSPAAWLDAIHAEDRPRVVDAAGKQMLGKYDIDYRITRPDGTERVIHDRAFPIRNAEGNIYRIAGVAEDVTESKQTELMLRRSNQRFALFMKHLPGVAFIKSGKGRLIFLGNSDSSLAVTTPQDGSDKSKAELFPMEMLSQLQNYDRQVLKSGKPLSVIEKVGGRQGTRYWLVNRFLLPNSDQGEPTLGGIAIDLTDLEIARNELKVQSERVSRLAAHLESVREEQNAVIARDVHDELGSTLTAIKLGLASLPYTKDDPIRLAENMDSMSSLIQSALESVKRIASNLRPGTLDTLGLIATIKSYTKEFSSLTEIKVILQLPQLLSLSSDQSITIFRIVQEAMTNVARHSTATMVRISLRKRGHILYLKVTDNGKGFKEETLNKPSAFGIIGMQERSLRIGADFNIRSVKGRGTTIRLQLSIP